MSLITESRELLSFFVCIFIISRKYVNVKTQMTYLRRISIMHKLGGDILVNLNNLFIRMKNLNLTVSKLSEATGISTGNIGDWKYGRSKPGADSLIALADYLDCSIDYILGRTDIPEVNRR